MLIRKVSFGPWGEWVDEAASFLAVLGTDNLDCGWRFRGDRGNVNCLDVWMKFDCVNWVCIWLIAVPGIDCFACMLLVACLVVVLCKQSLLVDQPRRPWLSAMIA